MKKILPFLVLSVLTACDVSTPSQISLRQIQLREGVKTETLDARSVDLGKADMIADAYGRGGQGSATLTVSYPAGTTGARLAAERQGAAWREALRARGMKVDAPAVVEVQDAGRAGMAILSWRSLLAAPPQGCTRIPGHQGSETINEIETYSIGCETQSAVSRMVANPQDLMGRAGLPDGDAKREGTMVDKHRAGTPNGKLNGLSASTVGAGGG